MMKYMRNSASSEKYLSKEASYNRNCGVLCPITKNFLGNCGIGCFQDVCISEVVCCYEPNIKCIILQKRLSAIMIREHDVTGKGIMSNCIRKVGKYFKRGSVTT